MRGRICGLAIELGAPNFSEARLEQIDEVIDALDAALNSGDFALFASKNYEFHELLCDNPQSPWCHRLLSNMLGLMSSQRHGIPPHRERLEQAQKEHCRIRDLLREGNFAAAAEMAKEHERITGDFLIRAISEVAAHQALDSSEDIASRSMKRTRSAAVKADRSCRKHLRRPQWEPSRFGTSANHIGGVEVLHGVSLDIKEGEFVALVGPSGCGKSTLLRMIAGLEEITGGEIAIGDRVINHVAPKDRNIAMVFQNYALYPHMNVRDNMGFALRQRRHAEAEIESRVNNAARILGLEHLLDRKPRALSGGQRQRVAMGRAIVREPNVFLFDEPLSNLDAKLRVQMRSEIKELHQRLKTTTVYVTHDQIEAMTLADRVVVMNGGVIEQEGPPLDLYDKPASRFVAAFIGSPPMNFLGNVSESSPLILDDGTGLQLPFTNFAARSPFERSEFAPD